MIFAVVCDGGEDDAGGVSTGDSSVYDQVVPAPSPSPTNEPDVTAVSPAVPQATVRPTSKVAVTANDTATPSPTLEPAPTALPTSGPLPTLEAPATATPEAPDPDAPHFDRASSVGPTSQIGF